MIPCSCCKYKLRALGQLTLQQPAAKKGRDDDCGGKKEEASSLKANLYCRAFTACGHEEAQINKLLRFRRKWFSRTQPFFTCNRLFTMRK